MWILRAYGFSLNISHFSLMTFATFPPHVLPSGHLVSLSSQQRGRELAGKGKRETNYLGLAEGF